MHYVSCQMYERGLVTIQAIQNEQPTPIFIMVLLKTSGWVHMFAIKKLSIIFLLESNPWKIIFTCTKTEEYKLITSLIVYWADLLTTAVVITEQKRAKWK